MNFKSRNAEEDVNINLTPLIDVVFLLLIFFMVSTTFDTTSQLKINLPEASQDQSVVPPQKLNLMIDAKGNFFLNSRELTNNKSATLKAALERTMDGNKLPIVIQSDADSPVQSLVTAMDVVGQLGLSQVSIATTRPLE
ncbi:MAG: biopolymer transporter ExbD [Gammaproteobacteria bacterium]|jgi:biopolymer transport protein ExbD|nr:biopolymer transporter ExbD [Gammaproteobacteria bacterium]MBT8436043.1 biopolymer transporter ExbD [Gammaproteobacteria bacterium]MDH3631400.1 biopolymer transporter ExbD [Gammaproteobacteria bacterium]